MQKAPWFLLVAFLFLCLVCPTAGAAEQYLVKKGDTLWSIARSRGIKVADILKLNHLADENRLQIGDMLLLPETDNDAEKNGTPATSGVGPTEVAETHNDHESGLNENDKQTDEILNDVGNQQQPAAGPVVNPPVSEPNRGALLRDIKARQIIAHAVKFIGSPYHRGGTTPRGFDCSGFVRYIFRAFGIDLPHASYAQAGLGKHIEKSDLALGDLVFFKTGGSSRINHVGIYVGGNRFIHASTNKGITITSLSDKYYTSAYTGARRILDNE